MNALMPLADGVEEMEAVIMVDVLRRAGWDVVTAGLHEGTLTASRGVCLKPDCAWSDVSAAEHDMLIIPGGLEGVRNLAENASIMDAIRTYAREDRWLAAICAGPLLFEAAGILAGRRVTAYPSVCAQLKSATIQDRAVVRDGHLVTGRGPGAALLFALTLVACLDAAKALELADSMVCDEGIKQSLSEVSCLTAGKPRAGTED